MVVDAGCDGPTLSFAHPRSREIDIASAQYYTPPTSFAGSNRGRATVTPWCSSQWFSRRLEKIPKDFPVFLIIWYVIVTGPLKFCCMENSWKSADSIEVTLMISVYSENHHSSLSTSFTNAIVVGKQSWLIYNAMSHGRVIKRDSLNRKRVKISWLSVLPSLQSAKAIINAKSTMWACTREHATC